LPIQRNHLDSAAPETNGVEVGRVDTKAAGVDTHYVSHVVFFKSGLLVGVFAEFEEGFFLEGEDVVVGFRFC
jgi:hypothetical protein